MMGRSRPRCKLRKGGKTNTKGKAQRVRNTTKTKMSHNMPKEKTHKKKRTQTVKALLQDSDRQVLRFHRLTPLLEIVCHLSAARETARLLGTGRAASLIGIFF